MKFNIKFTLLVFIFICWPTLSIANNDFISMEFPNYMDESLQHLCEDDKISLNFSNAVISKIGQDFISSSLITCLNLTNNNIQEIEKGSFNKLPNLTKLFLSNNIISNPFGFGSHETLEILVMNNASRKQGCTFDIFGNYPNLEILSIRNNKCGNFQYALYSVSETSKIPFPKLKILDLSENNLGDSNFVKMLSSNLHFLDLHENNLNFLDLSEIGGNLSMLNLDNNNLKYIRYWASYQSFSLNGLKNLQYLSISRNGIEYIESSVLWNIEKLVYLNLSGNNFNDLEWDQFRKSQFLSILDLSFNRFTYIPYMSNRTNISVLYLNGNMIEKLNPNTFVRTPKLTKLWLGKNKIDKIDVKAFADLFVLEELDLSWNNLNSLPEEWTKPFVSLKYLDLSHNKFMLLESLSLTNELPLMKMYLAMNPLKYLNIRYFESLPQNLTVYLV